MNLIDTGVEELTRSRLVRRSNKRSFDSIIQWYPSQNNDQRDFANLSVKETSSINSKDSSESSDWKWNIVCQRLASQKLIVLLFSVGRNLFVWFLCRSKIQWISQLAFPETFSCPSLIQSVCAICCSSSLLDNQKIRTLFMVNWSKRKYDEKQRVIQNRFRFPFFFKKYFFVFFRY
jgi:hypothetical protein